MKNTEPFAFGALAGYTARAKIFVIGKIILTIAMLVLMNACGQRGHVNVSASDSNWAPKSNLTNLTLVGFNYTNREISKFSVDGPGGGNVHVSSPLGGGGGSVCCVRYVAGDDVSQHTVRWDAESCRFDESGPGEGYDIRSFYKEEVVEVKGVPLESAHYFEVHFFPDGSVKAMVTKELSKPLLALHAERDRKRSPPCSESHHKSK